MSTLKGSKGNNFSRSCEIYCLLYSNSCRKKNVYTEILSNGAAIPPTETLFHSNFSSAVICNSFANHFLVHNFMAFWKATVGGLEHLESLANGVCLCVCYKKKGLALRVVAKSEREISQGLHLYLSLDTHNYGTRHGAKDPYSMLLWIKRRPNKSTVTSFSHVSNVVRSAAVSVRPTVTICK